MGTTLDFTDEELGINRAGRVSERQQTRLGRSRKTGRIALVVMGLLVVAFIVIIATVVLPKITKQNSDKSVPIVPIVVAVLAFVVLVMGLSIARTRRRLNRLTTGKAQQTTGAAKTRARRMHGNVVDVDAPGMGYGGGMRYELTIGSVRFIVPSQAVLDVFEDGRMYHGYYVGRGMMSMLLSAEPVTDPRQ
jgi:hypothetical protein